MNILILAAGYATRLYPLTETKAKPLLSIGPISGEINIAPIITAVELTFKPTEATIIAQAKIHKLAPEKEILPLTLSNVFC